MNGCVLKKMADEDNVLFLREDGNNIENDDDVWDDTALIKAYDKAVNLAKEQVAKRTGMEVQGSMPKQKSQHFKQFRHTSKPYKVNTLKKWTVGAPCRAVYSEDGEIYEAIISKIHENSGTCIVKFIGYGNTEKVDLTTLQESAGVESQIAQQKDALAEKCNQDADGSTYSSNSTSNKENGVTGEKMECDAEDARPHKHFFPPGPSFNSALDMMPPAPPLPPQLMAKLPETDADALSSMLMSWYISGFHTGYYHGLKHARNNQEKKKC